MHLDLAISTAYQIPTTIVSVIPSMFANGVQYLKVQPPEAEHPLSEMSIRGFEIRAAGFSVWRNIPASTTFVRYQRKLIRVCNACDEDGVLLY
jgi:hypothetical protein